MANVYACPVHVDQQSSNPLRLCPLCGLGSILLRADAAPPEHAPLQPAAPDPRPSADRPPPGDPLAELDQVIAQLTQIRDRLRNEM